MGKLRPFVRKDSYMPNKKWIPFVIGNGYTTTDGASGPAPEYETVTGNPVSFNAITPFPLHQLEVAFSPVQSGSGDPSPDNVRPISGWDSLNVEQRGKNLSDKIGAVPYKQDTGLWIFLKAGTYTAHIGTCDLVNWRWIIVPSKSPSGTPHDASLVTANGMYSTGGSWFSAAQVTNKAQTFTVLEDAYIQISISKGSGTTDPPVITEPMIELGTTASPYQPYNPSSRSISVTFPALGANQWDERYFQAKKNMNASGEVADNAEHAVLGTMEHKIPVKPNTEYRIIAPSGGSYACFYDANGNFISPRKYTNTGTITAYENAAYMLIGVPYTAETYGNDLGINYPSSVTTYEPYTNTVYSGTVDVVTGVVEINMAEVDMGDLSWSASGGAFAASVSGMKHATTTDERMTGIMSSMFKISNVASINNMPDLSMLRTDKIYVKDTSKADKDAFAASVSGVQLVYELATLFTIQLTPQEVESLAGDNTMWSDGDSLEVTYRSN